MRHLAQAARTALLPTALAGLLAAAAGPASAYGCGADLKVRAGDTLAGIAAHCGTTVGAFLAANPQVDHPSYIYAGEVLRVPLDARGGGYRHGPDRVVVHEPDAYVPRRDVHSPGYAAYPRGYPREAYVDHRFERKKRRAVRRMIRRAYREGLRDGRGYGGYGGYGRGVRWRDDGYRDRRRDYRYDDD